VERRSSEILIYLGMGGSLLYLLYAGSLFSETSFQLFLGWGLLALLWFLKRIPSFQEPPRRILFLLLAAFITVRYWMFRSFDSLLFASFWDSLGMMLLYLAETYGILIYFLGMFVSIWPLKRGIAPLPAPRDSWPTVDVLIPTFTEAPEIVMTTAIACTQLDYPREKLNIFILDDGSTVERRNSPDPEKAKAAWERHNTLRSIAETLRVTYLTRERNVRAKAGNLNEALGFPGVKPGRGLSADQLAWVRESVDLKDKEAAGRGELILLLDCDHVPTRDFLKNTVGYFLGDEKLFLVQTPHFFINPNPVEKNLGTYGSSPGENEMFYRAIQPGLDFWNSSFFCGSAAILRRKYLQRVGGIQVETITEDAETALAVHSQGLNSVFLDRPMVCGLSPETFDDFMLQRSRWTQGMLQIFSLKNPLWQKGLTWVQRICYLNSCMFWFFGLARLVFFISPLLYLFFGVRVYNASEWQVLGYAVPHIFGTIMVTDFLYGRVRHPFFSELYEAVQSMYLVPVILSTLINPRSPRFKVTPKGKSLETEYLSPLAVPFYLLFSLSLIGMIAAVFRWHNYPLEGFAVLICLFWNIFNFIFVLLCLGVVWELQQRRRYHRIEAEGQVEVTIPRLQKTVTAELQDLSLGGVSLQPPEAVPLEEGERVLIRAGGSNGKPFSLQASVVRNSLRRGKREWGCEFAIPDLSAFSEIVGFVYGDSSRWVKFWEERRSRQIRISRGFLHLIRIGWRGAFRNFKGVLFPRWQKWVHSTRALPGKVAFGLSLRRKILRALFAGLPKAAPAVPTSAEKNG
jgi:cellulose synthase (UDP-forming)